MRQLVLTISLLLAASGAHAAQREDRILIQGNDSGQQTVVNSDDGSARAEYSFSDRGRGDHILASWTLDAQGIPLRYTGSGNDYMKNKIDESFAVATGKATWHNRTEHGEQASSGPAFYVPLNAPPEFMSVLTRALLKAPGHRLALLPLGEAHLDIAASVTLADATKTELAQYRISGLSFSPITVWLDRNGQSAASISSWFSVLPKAYEADLATLQAAQDKSDAAWSVQLARELTHIPRGDLVIRHARLFDPRDLSITSDVSVLIRGERIVRVAADDELHNAASDAEIIDAKGRFLMPGLWDNHQHFGDNDGALDLIAGVTSTRDMANDTDGFLKRVERFDNGSELGPRVLRAGVIEGTGPLAAPTKMRADTAEQAYKDVDWYADHGYVQIKIYSSVKPELMPLIADHAHARGLRVSGHVPAFMSARQFVDGGADEIQHINFVMLNFLYPQVQETRNRDRFIKVAEHAREFTPEQPQVKEFIAFLKRHHTVLDPTVNVFEGLFGGDPTAITPGLEKIAPRFPPQIRRTLLSEALDVPKDQADSYRAAFPAILNLLKALYEAGVTIIPGTDALAGYTLHHELELYVRAGIPAPEVLRLATLTPAQVMGVDKDRGVIAAGKLADMILVDGDPTRNIGDIGNVAIVIKGGKVYEPSKIEQAMGIAPR